MAEAIKYIIFLNHNLSNYNAMKFFSFLGIILVGYSSLVNGQQESFNRALEAYRLKNYTQARSMFQKILSEDPNGPLTTTALLMLGKSYIGEGYFRQAERTASQLIDEFPLSRYYDDGQMVLARAAFENHDYETCFNSLRQIKKHSTDKQLLTQADETIRSSVEMLSLPSFAAAINSLPNDEAKNAFILAYTKKLIALGRYTKARGVLENVTKNFPKTDYAKTAKEWTKTIKDKNEGPVKIGLIVSLTGTNGEVGKSIKSGIELSIANYNKTSKIKIDLIIYDDRSDMIECIKAAHALSETDGLALIFGPIESEMMAAASVVANYNRVPIISPTAVQSGLTDIGPYIYQANADVTLRSDAIARYVIQKLGMKRFAILAPSDGYGESASNGFARAVEKYGGRILTYQKFYDNTTDFKSQITMIRKLTLIDQLDGAISSSKLSLMQIDSVYNQYFPVDPTADKKEEFAAPVHLDGIFLPVYIDDIKYIAPQIAFYNIQTRLLGGDNWYDETELRLQQNYIDSVIFVSEYFVSKSSAAAKSFNDGYRSLYKKEPAREASYGFDLMEMITQLVKAGAYTAEDMQAQLSKGAVWTGVHNEIRFTSESRVNPSVHLLQFVKGQVVKIIEH